MSASSVLVEGLATRGQQVLGDAVGRPGRFALVDFPNHSNVGDSAIWLGELAALSGLGLGPPAYVCDLETYAAEDLRRRVGGEGTILIHGGGNLGDLWPRHQELREQVIADHPDLPIVQLPQSLHFTEDAALRTAQRVIDTHPHLTLLLRDARSHELASAHFAARSELCPDLALCLPPRGRATAPQRDVQWLLRDDVEAAHHRAAALDEGVSAVDWLGEDPSGAASRASRLASAVRRAGPLGYRASPLLWRAWNAAARQRLERGVRVLSEGTVVVTDRLHAHILCLLLAIPHVVLPDRHGKISGFLETWTGRSDLVTYVPDTRAASGACRSLLPRGVAVAEECRS